MLSSLPPLQVQLHYGSRRDLKNSSLPISLKIELKHQSMSSSQFLMKSLLLLKATVLSISLDFSNLISKETYLEMRKSQVMMKKTNQNKLKNQ